MLALANQQTCGSAHRISATGPVLLSLSLTYEGEGRRQREKHAVTVHGECDSKVHGQTAQHEESVHRCPVRHLKPQLYTQKENTF